jgi:prepilin-type N-terminal cleavage/methylation domain-containing protein
MSKGFSLLELSIVLVIVGLLAGGVMVGQDLIRQAEIRSVLTDFDTYRAAFNAFKLKYNALPGDLRNATSYWGAQHTDPAVCQVTPSTGPQTCNGDGSGMIGVATSDVYETHRVWQHMANAGLVGGSFTGVAGPLGDISAVPGLNALLPEYLVVAGVSAIIIVLLMNRRPTGLFE